MSRLARCSACTYEWRPRSVGNPARCPRCGVRFQAAVSGPTVSVSSGGSGLAVGFVILTVTVGFLIWHATRPAGDPAKPEAPLAKNQEPPQPPVTLPESGGPVVSPPPKKEPPPQAPTPKPTEFVGPPVPPKTAPDNNRPLAVGDVARAIRADTGAVKDPYLYRDDATYTDTNSEQQHRQAIADKKAVLLPPDTNVKIVGLRYLSCTVELVQPGAGLSRGVMNLANLAR